MSLHAGVANVDITPPLGLPHGAWNLRAGLADGVHDPLLAKALVLTTDDVSIAIVTCDLLHVGERLVANVRQRVQDLTGIPASNVLVNAAHNHTSPVLAFDMGGAPRQGTNPFGPYEHDLVDRLAGAVYGACRHRERAMIGFGYATVDGWTVNRVWPGRTPPGDLTVMRVDSPGGRTIAVVTSFACHGTCVGGHGLEWGADFPARLRNVVEESLGGECLFLQGPAGDIAPLDFWFGNKHPQPMGFAAADRLGSAFAAAAVSCAQTISTKSSVRLASRVISVELARRRIVADPVALDDLEARIRAGHRAATREVWPSSLHTTNSAQREPAEYQLGVIAFIRDHARPSDSPIQIELQALRIGSAALLAMPFEPFSGVGTQIRDLSPLSVSVLGYSNGYQGYLPDTAAAASLANLEVGDLLDQSRIRWAYGITNAHMAPAEADRIVAASVALLAGIMET